MILTDITLTKKGRCALFVDGEFLFSAHPDVFYGSGWQKGREVTVEELEQLRISSEERTAKDKALDLLSYSARTGRQLYEKLARKTDPEAAAAAVARMEELGLVDDADYARRFVADKLNLKDWGLKRIVQELRVKGVDQQHIDVGGRDSGDTRCLTDGCRADLGELLARLDGERLQRVVVEIVGNGDILQAAHLLGYVLLALDVAAILDLNLRLLDLLGGQLLTRNESSELRIVLGNARNGHIVAQNDVIELATLRQRSRIDRI